MPLASGRWFPPQPRPLLFALCLAFTLAGPMARAVAAGLAPEPVPLFDIDATCRDQARYAFAATLGQADLDKEFSLCTSRERSMRTRVDDLWTRASATTRRDCVPLADAKSGAKYSTLAHCLDSAR